jgi:thiol-disulfide isomerase/thioredoxin
VIRTRIAVPALARLLLVTARSSFAALLALVLCAGCTAPPPAAPPGASAPEQAAPEQPAPAAPLTVTPERPRAGQSVTVTYHPRAEGARLHAPDTLELVWRTGKPNYRIVSMQKQGARWTAQVRPDSSARVLRFYVQSDSVKDQQGGAAGWGRMIYGADGEPVRGAHVARAAFLRAHYEGQAIRDTLMRAYRRERALHPDHLVARAHQRALQAQQRPARADSLRGAVLARIDSVRRQHAGDVATLREVQRAYFALGRRDRARTVGAAIAEAAPRSPEAEMAAFRRATAEGAGPARTKKHADGFLERFPGSFFESGVHEALFNTYRDAGQTEKMIRAGRRWIEREQVNRARAHRQLAEALAGAGRYDAALKHARRAVEAAPEASRRYSFYKTTSGWDWAAVPLTPRERRRHVRRRRGRERAVLGRIHYRRQNYAKAAEVLARAVRENPSNAPGWAHLAQARDKLGQPERARAAAREALRRQPSLRPARSLFRRLYAEQHGSEAGLDSTLARLARGHLLRERIDVAAPPLRLTRLPTSDSLRGDSLRAGALDGKVLVLDFWASWCGPCHEAFPHLQDVYEKYRDANDVKFLAVNTSWNDTKARARQFIDEAGYTFPLYWDAGGQVAGAFGVRSIPTTVLIGKGGRVQYREEGFSPRRYEEALTWRIDLLRGL